MAAADLGQASASVPAPSKGAYVLVSYLTTPVVTGTRLDYVLFATGGADADEYRWEVKAVSSGATLASATTENGTFHWTASVTGDVTVTASIAIAGAVVAAVSVAQQVTTPDATVEADAAAATTAGSGTDFVPVREMVNDLMTYMVAATTATGPNGIPLRMLAGVLYTEIYHRPKIGTASAAAKVAAGGDEDDIREIELEDMANIYDDFLPLRRELYATKSLGVGQMAQTTAAMVLGKISWRDQDPRLRLIARNKIVEDFRRLSDEEMTDIFNRLRFPRSNVAVAANLLAKLKNRPHRAPSLAAPDLLTSSHALEVIATEYQMGGTITPLAKAKPSGYGVSVNGLLSGRFPADLRKYFP